MHVILYVIDALRPDHLSCYGYTHETSPCIDRLARDGVVFENCFTPATWTRPVAASILTGLYPSVHRVQTRMDGFSSGVSRLPELFQEAGFRTAAFSAIGQVSSETGFDRGFADFFDLFREPDVCERRGNVIALGHGLDEEVTVPLAEDVNLFLLPWLECWQAENTFVLAWAVDTHDPYIPPEGFSLDSQHREGPARRPTPRLYEATEEDRDLLVERYDGEVRYVDHCIGQLVGMLEAQDLYDDSLLIITSDHGDAFYEHGFYSHGTVPFDELIRVPLIVKFPGSQWAGTRIPGLTQSVDIFPTVLGLGGVEFDPSLVQGQDLLALLEGRREAIHDHVYSETQSLPFLKRYLSVRSQNWKYILTETPESSLAHRVSLVRYTLRRQLWRKLLANPAHLLRRHGRVETEMLFCLDNDPAEQLNLVDLRAEMAEHFQEELRSWQSGSEQLAQLLGSQTYTFRESQVMKRHLEHLGYL
jgi:arylsulfatase A-like enzyme